MDEQGAPPRRFRFANPRQERIFDLLHRLVGPGPASFFRDACRMMGDPPEALDTRSHLVGHCVREIESAIRAVVEPLSKSRKPEGKPSKPKCGDSGDHRRRIVAILEELGVPDDDPVAIAWLRLTGAETKDGLHSRAHRAGLEKPRDVDAEFLQFWNRMQDILFVVLRKFETRFADVLAEVDARAANAHPTRDDIKFLRNNVPHGVLYRGTFFTNLQHPGWLDPLREAGFFSTLPEPVVDTDRSTISYDRWPQAAYLRRMAVHDNEHVRTMVIEILLHLPPTENINVWENVVDIALVVPVDLAAQLLPMMLPWAGSTVWSAVPLKLGELGARFARSDRTPEALRTVEAVLGTADHDTDASPPEPSAPHRNRLDPMMNWEVGEFRRKHLPDIVTAGGLETLQTLVRLLQEALAASGWTNPGQGRNDSSESWRPSIEPRDDYRRDDEIIDHLVSSILHAATQLVRVDGGVLAAVLTVLQSGKSFVFDRIALVVVAQAPAVPASVLRPWLVDEDRFSEPAVRAEYDLLLAARYHELLPAEQERLLSWMTNPAGEAKWQESFQSFRGRPPTPDEIATWRRRTIMGRLRPIQEHLQGSWREQYDAYLAASGVPPSASELREPKVWRGPGSPWSIAELRDMSLEEIIDYLKSWEPSGNIMDASPDGLGRLLSELVDAHPERFANSATRFQGLEPTYVRALLQGLDQAVRASRPFSWVSVLELCRWVVEQPVTFHSGRFSRCDEDDYDPDWGSSRRTIASLLETSLRNTPNPLPLTNRGEVWTILRSLSDDPDPTTEHEARYGGGNSDPASLAINCTRSLALSGIIGFAQWAAEGSSPAEGAPATLDAIPEVREVLERHLDPEVDPSLAVRSVYGQRYVTLWLLDGTWTRSITPRIFPNDPSSRRLWDAAWEAFLGFNDPHPKSFELLQEQYGHAITLLNSVAPEVKHFTDPDDQIGDHLVTLYLWGLFGDRPSGIFLLYLNDARGEFRRKALAGAGHDLAHATSLDPLIIVRAKQLWEDRVTLAEQRNGADAELGVELGALEAWFPARFDAEWSYQILLRALRAGARPEHGRSIIQQLASDGIRRSKESMAILPFLLLEGDNPGWHASLWNDEIHAILRTALAEAGETGQAALVLINQLLARGLLQFRDLSDA